MAALEEKVSRLVEEAKVLRESERELKLKLDLSTNS